MKGVSFVAGLLSGVVGLGLLAYRSVLVEPRGPEPKVTNHYPEVVNIFPNTGRPS